eukprot:scaffold62374_cov64-Phaeocystis_antarctica.AAC.1
MPPGHTRPRRPRAHLLALERSLGRSEASHGAVRPASSERPQKRDSSLPPSPSRPNDEGHGAARIGQFELKRLCASPYT